MEYPIYEEYPAWYRDARGEEETVIRNDGESLRMTVRGVEFAGWMLDDFEPVEGTDPAALEPFTLHSGSLWGYEIEYDVSQPMIRCGQAEQATLHVQIVLGPPGERGGVTGERFTLRLLFDEHSYESRDESGWIENALLEVQAALPDGVYMKNCFNCASSDYSPGGNGAFGCMKCFRNDKNAYLSARSKNEFFRLKNTEWVQETYLCPEFDRRVPGTGYRG